MSIRVVLFNTHMIVKPNANVETDIRAILGYKISIQIIWAVLYFLLIILKTETVFKISVGRACTSSKYSRLRNTTPVSFFIKIQSLQYLKASFKIYHRNGLYLSLSWSNSWIQSLLDEKSFCYIAKCEHFNWLVLRMLVGLGARNGWLSGKKCQKIRSYLA